MVLPAPTAVRHRRHHCESEELLHAAYPTPVKHPVTMAIRALRKHDVPYEPHLYTWEPHGGTRASAEALGVDEHAVIKTLIFEDDAKAPLCILMHGDKEVSAKQLARV